MLSCTSRNRSKYSPCFSATFLSRAATSLFLANAIALVVYSNALPGDWSELHIHVLDVIHTESPTMRSSRSTSTALRPSIIIQHS